MDLSILTAISPVDGRYRNKVEALAPYKKRPELFNIYKQAVSDLKDIAWHGFFLLPAAMQAAASLQEWR